MRWIVRALAAAVVLAAGMGNAQQAQPKLALIIGNADYDLNGRVDLSEAAENAAKLTGHQPDLANPINDARDIRDALARLGFDVSSYKENASKIDMIGLLDSFGRKITAAGPNAIVLVYYSGHGMQIEGENFLVPAGAQLVGADFSQMSASAMQAILSGVAVPTSFLRAQLKPRTGDGVNIIILDACRNNPWDPVRRGTGGRGRGLADQDWGLGQTLIAFSTAPGTTAYDGAASDRNSPYTAALKSTIGQPNLDVFNMFNTVARAVERQTTGWRDGAQRPWINSVTLPNVCLAGCSPIVTANSQSNYNVDRLPQEYLLGDIDPVHAPGITRVPASISDRAMFGQQDAVQALISLSSAATHDHIRLIVLSAFRSYHDQKTIWDDKWAGRTLVDGNKLDQTVPDADERTEKILQFSSAPGMSRHHWGTDFDFNALNNEYFEAGEGARVYAWLQSNAPKFGFCQVYGEQPIVEKWHWSFMPVAKKYLEQYPPMAAINRMPNVSSAKASDALYVRSVIAGFGNNCNSPVPEGRAPRG